MPRLAAFGALAAAAAAATWVVLDPSNSGLPLLLAALASNFFLGQGPWTPWQMLGWGACGLAGAFLAPLIRRRAPFAAVCFVLGFAFSALMDLWLWVTFWPHTWQALTVVFGQGFSFEAAHAIGNVVIALAIGPELLRLLERYSRRLRTEVIWVPEGGESERLKRVA